MINILIADDEERIRKLLNDFLRREGYHVIEAGDGSEALDIYEKKKETISLIILDVMMPICDGWSVLRKIRAQDQKLPIIMLTARGEEADEVFGLDLGADDYISKPFSPITLTARIKVLLRKQLESDIKSRREYGGFAIDEIARTVSINGQKVDLSPKEYELLVYLVLNKNIAVSRDQILNIVWGYDYFGDARTIDTHIKKIRSKLGAYGDTIRTVRNYGYRFEYE